MRPTLSSSCLDRPQSRPVAFIGPRPLGERKLSQALKGEWLELWQESPSIAHLLSTTLLGAVRILGEELGVHETVARKQHF